MKPIVHIYPSVWATRRAADEYFDANPGSTIRYMDSTVTHEDGRVVWFCTIQDRQDVLRFKGVEMAELHNHGCAADLAQELQWRVR